MPAEKYSLSSYLTQYITNHDFFLCLLFHFIISLCPLPVKVHLTNRSHVSVSQFSNRQCQNVVRGTQGAAEHVTIVLILVSSVIYYCDKAFPLFDCAITKVFSMFSFFFTSYVISYIQDMILKMSFTDL